MTEKGVKVTALSRSTKIPVQTIHGWLQGKAPRNINQVKVVSDYFGVSLDCLVYAEEQKTLSPLETQLDEIKAGVWEVILKKPTAKN